MKKFFKFFAVMFVVSLLCGCTSGKEKNISKAKEEYKIVSCNMYRNDVVNGYELSSKYNITTDGTIVKKVETTEVVTSENSEVLSYFETTLTDTYNKMNEAYGGYDVNVTNKDGAVTSITKIDYEKINLAQLKKDEPSIAAIVNGNDKITLDGIIRLYETMGATCDK